MDLHPLVVHFPVALLSLYAVAECLRFKRLLLESGWFVAKGVLLIIGSLTSFIALGTGEIAEELRGESALIEAHSAWATATAWIFGVLAVLYLITLIMRYKPEWALRIKVASIGAYAQRIVAHWAVAIVALAGLAALTITGALGAALVHGPNIDPAVSVIYTMVMGKDSNQMYAPVGAGKQSAAPVIGKTFTATDVAKHNSRESCYSIIRNEVYDLTTAIDTHPGGAEKILRLCGKDGTEAFVDKHGGSPRQENALVKLKIGEVGR